MSDNSNENNSTLYGQHVISRSNDGVKIKTEGAQATEYDRPLRYVVQPVNENDLGDLTGVVPFANDAETADAMSKRAYRFDPNYRREVNRRLAAGLARQR